MGANKKIGEMLVAEGIIGEDVAQRVLEEQKRIPVRFGALLVNSHLVSEGDIARALSRQYGLEHVDVNKLSITSEALLAIPEKMAKRHLILPVRIENKTLVAVISDPLNIEGVQEMEFSCGMKIHPLIGDQRAVTEAITYHYKYDASLEDMADLSPSVFNIPDIEKGEQSAPIIKLVSLLLTEAVENRASDIHIEPSKDFVIVRFRIDGVLMERTKLSPWVQGPITSRIKILARLNIAEKRLPQDGGVRSRIAGG